MIPTKERPVSEVAAKRTVELDFEIGQKVKIAELDRPGVVISIHITSDGAKYETRYFWDGSAKEVYFYPWEIEPQSR